MVAVSEPPSLTKGAAGSKNFADLLIVDDLFGLYELACDSIINFYHLLALLFSATVTAEIIF